MEISQETHMGELKNQFPLHVSSLPCLKIQRIEHDYWSLSAMSSPKLTEDHPMNNTEILTKREEKTTTQYLK